MWNGCSRCSLSPTYFFQHLDHVVQLLSHLQQFDVSFLMSVLAMYYSPFTLTTFCFGNWKYSICTTSLSFVLFSFISVYYRIPIMLFNYFTLFSVLFRYLIVKKAKVHASGGSSLLSQKTLLLKSLKHLSSSSTSRSHIRLHHHVTNLHD